MRKLKIPLLLILLLIVNTSQAQDMELLGLIDNKLVLVDSLTGEIETFCEISNLPSGENIADLTYHKGNQIFYSIKETSNSPSLVSISKEGDFKEIAPLTLNGNQILMAEALAYNSNNNKLYAGVMFGFMIAITYTFSLFENVSDQVRMGAFVFIFGLYDPVFTSLFGGTIGHMIIGIRVKRESILEKNILFPLAIVRFAVKIILGWISLLTVGRHKKRMAIHDLVIKSLVLYKTK